jgi:hypothetical protein
MRVAFAVNDPPIQFAASDLLNIKILGRYTTYARVECNEFRERLFIVGVRVSALEDDGPSRRMIRHHIRAQYGKTILTPQQRSKLADKRQPLVSVIGLPHRRLQPANLVGLEIAQTVGPRRVQVPRGPGENSAGNGSAK